MVNLCCTEEAALTVNYRHCTDQAWRKQPTRSDDVRRKIARGTVLKVPIRIHFPTTWGNFGKV